MNTEYRLEVSWSDEDQAWSADVPDLGFCPTHRPTPHDAVAEVERAVEAWTDAAQATSRPLPEPRARADHG